MIAGQRKIIIDTENARMWVVYDTNVNTSNRIIRTPEKTINLVLIMHYINPS